MLAEPATRLGSVLRPMLYFGHAVVGDVSDSVAEVNYYKENGEFLPDSAAAVAMVSTAGEETASSFDDTVEVPVHIRLLTPSHTFVLLLEESHRARSRVPRCQFLSRTFSE